MNISSESHRMSWFHKVRMMAGAYMLQSTRDRFNQYSVEETCPLCRLGPEELSHMLLRCPALASVRIRDLVVANYGHTVWSSLSWKSDVVAILVDSHKLKSSLPVPIDNEVVLQLEALRCRYCFQLHSMMQQDCNYIENWQIFWNFNMVATTRLTSLYIVIV